jgi:hypothetical protein
VLRDRLGLGRGVESVVDTLQIQHEAIPQVVPRESLEGPCDLAGRQHLDVGDDTVLAAEVEQLLGVSVSAAAA